MRSTIIILLLCLSTNLFAQVNDYNLVEKEIRSLPDEEGKDSIFNYLFLNMHGTNLTPAYTIVKKKP